MSKPCRVDVELPRINQSHLPRMHDRQGLRSVCLVFRGTVAEGVWLFNCLLQKNKKIICKVLNVKRVDVETESTKHIFSVTKILLDLRS